MDSKGLTLQSEIVFLYYRDLDQASAFFADILGLELVRDQGLARIYRVRGHAFIGAVDEARGHCRAQERNAVVITFHVADVEGWHDHLRRNGVKIRREIREFSEIGIRCFFFEDPGGYIYEIQEQLDPELALLFGGS